MTSLAPHQPARVHDHDRLYPSRIGFPALTPEQLQILLNQIIRLVMMLLTRKGYRIEEQDMIYMAETDTNTAMVGW